MEPDLISEYNITVYNITLPQNECIGGSFTRFIINYFIGYDTVVINQAMWQFQSDGYIRNLSTNETWSWEKDNFEETPIILGIIYKVFTILLSYIAYFFISNITAFIIRVLLGSGVIITFPLFLLLRNCLRTRVQIRHLSGSYPWLGDTIYRLIRSNHSIVPFVAAHLIATMIFYSSYESTQFVWGVWLYGSKSIPSGLPIFVFAIVMIWEYYAILFCRS